eukprot:EG_transcript_12657
MCGAHPWPGGHLTGSLFAGSSAIQPHLKKRKVRVVRVKLPEWPIVCELGAFCWSNTAGLTFHLMGWWGCGTWAHELIDPSVIDQPPSSSMADGLVSLDKLAAGGGRPLPRLAKAKLGKNGIF